MEIQLVAVNNETKHILGNLLEYYVYEFTSYLNIEVNQDGKYGFTDLDQYITDEYHYPYLIKCDENLAGFAIVKQVKDESYDYCMEQFFILRKYNGKGIGRKAAVETFNRYKGSWQITQVEKNYSAQAFWRKVIKEYTNNQHQESYDENRRSVQRFVNS